MTRSRSHRLFLVALAAQIALFAGPAHAAPLVNPSFESPAGSGLAFPKTMPGWSTTDSVFEIWVNGMGGITAPNGRQWIELNSFKPSTVSQKSAYGDPGAIMALGWAHRGRAGTDTARATIRDSAGQIVASSQFSTGNTAWRRYRLSFRKPDGDLSYAFSSVSSVGRADYGNFLDDISLRQVFSPAVASRAAALDLARQVNQMEDVRDVDCATFGARNLCVALGPKFGLGATRKDWAGLGSAAWRIAPDARLGVFVESSPGWRRDNGAAHADGPMAGAFAAYGLRSKAGLSGRLQITSVRHAMQVADLSDVYGEARIGQRSNRLEAEVGYGLAAANDIVLMPFASASVTKTRRKAAALTANEPGWAPVEIQRVRLEDQSVALGLRASRSWDKFEAEGQVRVDRTVSRSGGRAAYLSNEFTPVEDVLSDGRKKTRPSLQGALAYALTPATRLGVRAAGFRSESRVGGYALATFTAAF